MANWKITSDFPNLSGYSGHTDAENAAALDTASPLGAFNAPPIHDILIGFPFFPNAVTLDDVTNCK